MIRKIKVLVVDDSVSVQNALTQVLRSDPEFELTGLASDPYEAVAKIARDLPDVITLDLQMPRMDGLTFLAKLMKQHPIPVVVISSVAGEESGNGIKALKLGASDIITKPKLSTSIQLEEYRIRITDAIKAAAMTGPGALRKLKALSVNKTQTNPEFQSTPITLNGRASDEVILIGASTGGTEVISHILKNLRTDLPGILIVQHMPGEFTGAFANRLNMECALHVKEAEQGDVVMHGCVYIANGFNHLSLIKEDNKYKCRLEMSELVNRHRPAVDVLFMSAIKFPGDHITAALFTGMGTDGAKGLFELNEAGAKTFAQDEKSSIIFGMPKEAIRLNAAKMIGNPDDFINWLNAKIIR